MATLDSIQIAVDSLTDSTTTLLTEVTVSKTTLTNSKDAAAASAAAASTSEGNAATSETNAAASSVSAASSAAAAAQSELNLDIGGLAAIAASKAITAVDGFVYDTSLDSDGGAWRDRCKHTSWYQETLNTATRGATRKFPAVAVIIVEVSKVTIFDGDDPSLPMWMVFQRGAASWANGNMFIVDSAITSVEAKNASIAVGEILGLGIEIVNFISEKSHRHTTGGNGGSYRGNISQRTDGKGWPAGQTTGFIVQSTINDLAMTVLPNAPIDPATGLPIPTIAVATDGGVSVIKDDGNVWDYIVASRASYSVGFYNSRLFAEFSVNAGRGDCQIEVIDMLSTDANYNTAGIGRAYYAINTTPATSGDAFLQATATASVLAIGSTDEGLTILNENLTTPDEGMVAYITSKYNTGFMKGDIKGAWLSSVDTTSLVGSGELITNGTFDSNIVGWTGSDGDAVLSFQAGELRIENGDGTAAGANRSFAVTAGASYILSFDSVVGTASTEGVIFGVGSVVNSFNITNRTNTTNGKHTLTFTAETTAPYYLLIKTRSAILGEYIHIDNVSVRLADADRSVNYNGLQVNGTITRTPVATGAELVGYSGFSATNYLEQPYNADLDFGTGDFCVMGWAKSITATKSAQGLIRRGSGGTRGWEITRTTSSGATTTNNALAVRVTGVTNVNQSGGYAAAVFDVGVWKFITLLRRSGVIYVCFNGELIDSWADAGDVSVTPVVTTIGQPNTTDNEMAMALWRISATAPTNEDVATIYNHEKGLFQENAKAVLAADSVTALAYDEVTKRLKIGGASGMSTMQDGSLQIVERDAVAVSTFISSTDDLEIKQ